jgi:hypothetical protein
MNFPTYLFGSEGQSDMRPARKGLSAAVIALVAVVAVFGGAFGYYFLTTSMTVSSLSSQNSSYASGLSSADEIIVSGHSTISSQRSEIQCLQSEVSSMNGTVGVGLGSVTCSITSLSSTSESNPIDLTGTLTVPSGTGQGILVVNVKNTADVPITGVSVNIASAALEAPNGTIAFVYLGAPISGTNPLPPGEFTSGNTTVISGITQLNVSYGYSFNVSVNYQDGSSQIDQFYVTAEV